MSEPRVMNAPELYDFLRNAWQRGEDPGPTASFVGCDREDVKAFFSCMYAGTAPRIVGARSIVDAIIGLRQGRVRR